MARPEPKCPVCGSRNLHYGKTYMKGTKLVQDIRCDACGHEWTQEY